MEHTKAKWEIKGQDIIGNEMNEYICTWSGRIANAQLIASAPELLKACKEAARLYDHLSLSPIGAAVKYGDNYEPPTDEEYLSMRKALEQAIAKAQPKENNAT